MRAATEPAMAQSSAGVLLKQKDMSVRRTELDRRNYAGYGIAVGALASVLIGAAVVNGCCRRRREKKPARVIAHDIETPLL